MIWWALCLVGGPLPALDPPAAESIQLERATLDPERRARLEAWWRELRAAEPQLGTVRRHLRRELEGWRGRPHRSGCQRARRALAAVDREALTREAEFDLKLGVAHALEQFESAALACLERRYFEFDYRLRVAEAALDRARELVRAQLARPRPP